MSRVFIALGSNIEPETNLLSAAASLRAFWPDTRFSRVYRSAPMGHEEQAFFLNAVGMMETTEPPEEIIKKLQSIEQNLKKETPFRFGPRTIDLDLLLFDNLTLHDPAFTLPHPRMHERRFVLAPLLDLISPEDRHPSLHQTWSKLLDATQEQTCELFPLHLEVR